jgi:hypothetical protein
MTGRGNGAPGIPEDPACIAANLSEFFLFQIKLRLDFDGDDVLSIDNC